MWASLKCTLARSFLASGQCIVYFVFFISVEKLWEKQKGCPLRNISQHKQKPINIEKQWRLPPQKAFLKNIRHTYIFWPMIWPVIN